MTELEDKTKNLLNEINNRVKGQEDFEAELLELFGLYGVEVEV